MNLVSVAERLKEIRDIMSKARYTAEDNAEIVNIRNTDCPLWSDSIGGMLELGQIVMHNNIKYLVMQTVYPNETQTPDGLGMLAIYKPYTDGELKEWIYGEYVEIGWQRIDGNAIYQAIQDPNTNDHRPSETPAIWELVSEIESEEI